MKAIIVILPLLFFVGCQNGSTKAMTDIMPRNEIISATPQIEDISPPIKRDENFKNVDFENFTYYSSQLEKNIKLNKGKIEKQKESWRASFQAVVFFDITNDGKNEALVELAETSSGGSSTTYFNYYLYESVDQKPQLLWRLSTGSESGCGHKAVSIKEQKIILEVFGDCVLNKSNHLDNQDENVLSDVEANFYTRFVFGYADNQVKTLSREVFPYPEKEIHNDLYKHKLKASIQNASN